MYSKNPHKYIILNFMTKPIQRLIILNYNEKVEELTTDSRNRFSFKVKPILQLNLLADIKKLEDFSCEITFHKFLNQTERITYIQNCRFDKRFGKKTLKKCIHSQKAQLKRASYIQGTLTLRQCFLPSTCKNRH